ncbi:MAG TPA: glutathione transferase GstA [bacterium]|nr:glutathione transferase GstA [bacterium]
MAPLTLHYLPGACSLSVHIALREAGLDFHLDRVDRSTPVKKTQSGEEYLHVNPKGVVPALRIPGLGVLTECAAILQWVADQNPRANLAPAAGTLERYRLQEWLNYVTADLHEVFKPLFRPTTPEAYLPFTLGLLAPRYAYVDKHLARHPYLLGDAFTVADAYAFTVLRWARVKKIDLAPYPHLVAYLERVGARPHVQAALQAEGLTA